jgi:hypothetical protein
MFLRKVSIVTVLAAGLVGATVTPANAAVDEASGFAVGTVNRVFNDPGTPLLDHFYYRYTTSDHHIKRVSALPQPGGTIQVAFHDNNSDDRYFYRVAGERVSSAGIVLGSYQGRCVGQCDRALSRPAGNYVFVLRGFQLAYRGTDHHIDEIGVREIAGRLHVAFNDKNNDDAFDFLVRYAWVPRARLSTVASVSGSVSQAAGGVVQRAVPAGTKVIRGFRVDYPAAGVDHHIRTFGVFTNWNNIAVYYGDKNPYDSGSWQYAVNYAVLA